MRWGQPLGLDELMIVNPGPSGSGVCFLGEDGTLYQVQGLEQEDACRGIGRLFLGEDGTLYQTQELGEDGGRELSGFFLGDDGTLYQVIRD